MNRSSNILAALFCLLTTSSLLARSLDSFERIQTFSYSDYYTQKYSHLSQNNFATVSKTHLKKGTLIIVDTRDQEQCSNLEKKLSAFRVKGQINERSELCRPISSDRPYNAVTIMQNMQNSDFYKEINISGLVSNQTNIFTETRNLFLASVGVAGALYLLPESVTKWNKNDERSITEKWLDNVKEGPVMDKDDWAINYIGHPISGAVYYQVARGLDYTPLQSFGYSFIMSTFFWEYGVEAFAETPSIQDLWSTPVIGALLGELFYRLDQRIQNNGGTVLGSKKLGNFSMILLNPANALSNKINGLLGQKLIQDAKFETFNEKNNCQYFVNGADSRCSDSTLGLRLKFKH